MKGFILVTNKNDGRKCCVAVNAITVIDELSDGTAFITKREGVTSVLKQSVSFGIPTVESFDEVMKLIENSI